MKTPDGALLAKGRRLTSWTDSEEEAVGLSQVVPFLLETELRALGAEFERVEDWGVYVVTDGLLTTGQNPASSGPTATKLLAELKK